MKLKSAIEKPGPGVFALGFRFFALGSRVFAPGFRVFALGFRAFAQEQSSHMVLESKCN